MNKELKEKVKEFEEKLVKLYKNKISSFQIEYKNVIFIFDKEYDEFSIYFLESSGESARKYIEEVFYEPKDIYDLLFCFRTTLFFIKSATKDISYWNNAYNLLYAIVKESSNWQFSVPFNTLKDKSKFKGLTDDEILVAIFKKEALVEWKDTSTFLKGFVKEYPRLRIYLET